ncbi:AraC family transcriptional regulator [Spirosoma fluminis]
MNFYNRQVANRQAQLQEKAHLIRLVIRSKAFMDRHFAEGITLDDIAQEACLSKFHFLRLFKSFYGVTPCQYLKFVRISQAKQRLKADESVADVCLAVGFDSVTSFAGLFKSITGSTPVSYRKKAILKK